MGKFLLHLNFLILLAFNLLFFLAVKIGFSFSVVLEFIICLFSFLYIALHGGLSRITFGKYKLPLLFLGIISVSFLFHYHEDSAFKLQVLLVRTFFIIFVIDLFISSGFRLNKYIIFVAGVIFSLLLIYNASLTGFQLRTSLVFEETNKSRIITGVIEDSRTLAFILVYLFMVNFRQKRLLFTGIFVIFLGLLVTQTRQTILVLLLCFMPYILFSEFSLVNFLKRAMLLVFFLFFISFVLKYNDVNIYETRLGVSDRLEDSGRANLLRWAYELFEEKPIFGYGFGYTDVSFSYPHNIILEVMAELGIIGLVFFLIALIHRYWVVNDVRIRTLIILTFFLALFSGNISQNYLFFFALIVDRRYFESNTYTEEIKV